MGTETFNFYAPGRVNIIGEHIDYNGGMVLPCALNFGTNLSFKLRDDDTIKLFSKNFDLEVTEKIKDVKYKKENDWANYPLGIVYCFKDKIKTGFEMVFDGKIPNGAGLSSSASIELVTAVALNEMFNLKLDMLELVKICQKTENEFMGVNCGIMDQFAVGMGRKDMAILLDCATLDYKYTPFNLSGNKLIVCNTNKRRTLSDSKYNERRNECERALIALNKKLNISNLCDISLQEFNENKHLIEDKTLLKRARHAVSENERVKLAFKALNENDIAKLGKLMIDSHNSLKDDYEVSGIELDTLVYEANKLPFVLGARMTGAGFGGCAVAIVEDTYVEEFCEKVTIRYESEIGYKPDFYVAEIGSGASKI